MAIELYSQPPAYANKFKGQGMISLSFDDGREDFYRLSYPIMKSFGLLGTFHIVTGWSDSTWRSRTSHAFGENTTTVAGAMSIQEIQECHEYGIEMSAHGDVHDNTRQNIIDCVDKLKKWGVTRNGIVDGFASPGSNLNLDEGSPSSLTNMEPWFKASNMSHARSGLGKSVGNYYIQNNNSYPPLFNYRITSQVVMADTEITQLLPGIYDAIYNKRWCIIMLHSIMRPQDLGYGNDSWYWDLNKFVDLCRLIASFPDDELLCVTLRDGIRYANGLRDFYE